MRGASWLGQRVEVEVEAPLGSLVKRSPSGAVDMISPWPLPWNYGFVVGEAGGDGDPLDAILVGRRRGRGARTEAWVIGVVDFEDQGHEDLKLVCATGAEARRPSWALRGAVRAFFAVYPGVKRVVYWWRGTSAAGATRLRGIGWGPGPVTGR